MKLELLFLEVTGFYLASSLVTLFPISSSFTASMSSKLPFSVTSHSVMFNANTCNFFFSLHHPIHFIRYRAVSKSSHYHFWRDMPPTLFVPDPHSSTLGFFIALVASEHGTMPRVIWNTTV